MKRVNKKDLAPYVSSAWAYMHSRYPPELLIKDALLKSEVFAIAELIYLSHGFGRAPTWEEIDIVRAIHDYSESKGPKYMWKIYAVLFQPQAWKYYKQHTTAKSRRSDLEVFEKNIKSYFERLEKNFL